MHVCMAAILDQSDRPRPLYLSTVTPPQLHPHTMHIKARSGHGSHQPRGERADPMLHVQDPLTTCPTPVLCVQGFLEKFFPEVQLQHDQTERDRAAGITRGPDSNPYCQYDNQALQWFTSCLFVAGVVAALPAGWCTRHAPTRTARGT